jgi:hypothetical protein
LSNGVFEIDAFIQEKPLSLFLDADLHFHKPAVRPGISFVAGKMGENMAANWPYRIVHSVYSRGTTGSEQIEARRHSYFLKVIRCFGQISTA